MRFSHRWAVVLAGGDGTRLQELTRRISGDARPKQFCPFFGGKSLLQHTRERIAPLFDPERMVFSLSRAHRRFYDEQLGDVESRHKVVQPANRGTALGMALCLQTIAQEDPDAVIAFFPSDHYYTSLSEFSRCIEHGLGLVEEYPHAVLIVGAAARYPEVEYGWIEPGRTLVESLDRPLLRVARFWEKPTLGCARRLRKQGCLWNTFVTIGLAGAFLEMLRATIPQLMEGLRDHDARGRLDEFYESIEAADFSRAVLTRMPERLVVLRDGASGWTDFGSPRRVMDVLSTHRTQPSWLVASSVCPVGLAG